jgi:hypothetical protein
VYKTVLILYIVVFSTYILFSRQPDYFDGEYMPATIHFVKEENEKTTPRAFFQLDKKEYNVNASYVFRSLEEGEKHEVIYEKEHPEKAAIYSFWGYWITWQELIGSAVLLILLFQVALKITSNPSPEALIEEIENEGPRRKKKYTS